MDLRLLKTFLSVAQIGNVTQAAKELNFSQPTVTAQIRTLEEHFGVLLFDRVGKRLYITEAGERLITYAEKLLLIDGEAQAALQEFSYDRTIKIGLGTAVAAHTLSPVLREFQGKMSNISVNIEHCLNIPVTVKGILDNSFDFALVHDKVSNSRILQFDVAEQKLLWVAHPCLIEKYGNDAWQHPFIALKQESIYRTMYEGILREKRISPILEYSDSEAVKQAVLNGLGIAVLPEILVESSIKDGTLIEFKHVPKMEIIFSVIFHREKTFSVATRTLLTMLAARQNIQSALSAYLLQSK